MLLELCAFTAVGAGAGDRASAGCVGGDTPVHTCTHLPLPYLHGTPHTHSFYGESIPGSVLCERLASYKHLHNLYWYTR